MARVGRPGELETALLDSAAVVAAWGTMALAEALVVSLAWGQEFSAAWEIVLPRRLVVPMAIAGLAPVSLVVVGWWRVAGLAREGRRVAVGALGAAGAVAGGALALGVSTGRHFASWSARGPFVVALVVAGAAGGVLAVPRVAGLARRPGWLGALGGVVLVAAWLADALVLRRLYPALHLAMIVASLLGGALVALAMRGIPAAPSRAGRAMGVLMGAVIVVCALLTPHAARELDRLSNLRIILVEHAPILGRTVEAAEAVRPHEASEDRASQGALPSAEVTRALDWTGHDIVLVTVDALRADHVSAYGYARATTPSFDALAREGTLFDAAYCPTPHTSYSITSMMTGKYLRPLLALGLGEDSETWAQDLRRYGWRTAAFYPPAVFFIDEDRFPHFEETRLGFEYAKVEFADPALREAQVGRYLDGAPATSPLFLWVHFFEPHEPYVAHPEHVFTGGRSPDEDAYDGEVAAADDGIGRIVRLVRARRASRGGAVVVVTADHGEEFGEHGGRYHGTTVYEEQVRVPLVVVGPGVRGGVRVPTVAQTIDLLPTALSALGIPRPARLRGRDLGPVLAGDTHAVDGGLAFAETDDYALVASGPDRLVCARRAAACALYRPGDDPAERRDLSGSAPGRFDELRRTLRSIERDHGRYEGGGGPTWPEALRRGMQGDADAAGDAAALLDDADVAIRRKAAEVIFALHEPSTAPQLRRALAREEDETVRRWSALALTRVSADAVPPLAEALLKDGLREWRRRAAIALGEHGDPRACEEITAWWTDVMPVPGQGSEEGEPPRLAMELTGAQELLGATTRARCRSAVPGLLRALADVRARPFVADALGSLGDDRASPALRAMLAHEPYVTTRSHEARALLAIGARDWSAVDAPAEVHVSLKAPYVGALRVIALLSDGKAELAGDADGTPMEVLSAEGEVRELEGRRSGDRPSVRLDLRASTGGVVALWLAPAPAPHDLIEKPGWRK